MYLAAYFFFYAQFTELPRSCCISNLSPNLTVICKCYW